MNASYFSLITQKQRFMIFPRRIHVGSNERWREPQLSFHTSIVSSKAIKKKDKRKNSSFKLFHAIKVSIMHHIQVFVSTQDRFRPDEYKTALIINFHLSHWHKSKFKKRKKKRRVYILSWKDFFSSSDVRFPSMLTTVVFTFIKAVRCLWCAQLGEDKDIGY